MTTKGLARSKFNTSKKLKDIAACRLFCHLEQERIVLVQCSYSGLVVVGSWHFDDIAIIIDIFALLL